ncbi:MAG: hypothetical protein ACOC4Y_01270 [bacterium]
MKVAKSTYKAIVVLVFISCLIGASISLYCVTTTINKASTVEKVEEEE